MSKKNILKRKNSVKQNGNDFSGSPSDELSQLCKSSQFIREIEIAMCECDSPADNQNSNKNTNSKINASCQCEKTTQCEISPEILLSNSIKWDERSPGFSISTQSCPDSLLKNSNNKQILYKSYDNNISQKPKLVSLSLKKDVTKEFQNDIGIQVDDIFNRTDPFCFEEIDNSPVIEHKKDVNEKFSLSKTQNELIDKLDSNCTIFKLINTTDCIKQNILSTNKSLDQNCTISKLIDKNQKDKQTYEKFDSNCTISKLMDSSDYKKQVNAGFENLQTSIIHDKTMVHEKTLGVPSNITINGINWDESLVRSGSNHPNSSNNSFYEEFNELGPFYGLPQKVKPLIEQFKGIKELYDWQDECLKLDAIKRRRNLVYSLPTSGGKTLVSEILIMREVLCRKRNALLVLPYVAIVQEKIWAFSPFAVSLEFLLEEYAAGRGELPPRKRRYKNAVYIATIEKALSLINSLTEHGRLSEIGLVVVDELHLMGEEGRGATLESLLTKILSAEEKIQIVGMSATIGNIHEVCKFLKADNFTKDFRPVDLEEFVCCSGELALSKNGQLEPVGKAPGGGYSKQMEKIDPDKIGAFVSEVVPNGSCLLFCPTKKNCENVALLLTRVLSKDLLQFKKLEKYVLIKQIESEGIMCETLRRTLPFGIAYHHSGLTMDERRLIEDAFRAGNLCVICCTSTLAAGVNLPAQRVILRSPYIGIEFISLARYKQMVGRAGRAGLSEVGQSILICDKRDMDRVRLLLDAPMDETISKLHNNDNKGLKSLILSCIALNIANTRRTLQHITAKTLMSVQENRLTITTKSETDQAISELFKQGALQVNQEAVVINPDVSVLMQTIPNISAPTTPRQLIINNDTPLVISKLGKAAIKSGLDLEKARLLYEDLTQAQASLVLLTCLHLLYLVTPYDLISQIRPKPATFYSIYSRLALKELETAKIIGITEACAISMISGKKINSVPERVLNRFYLSLMLYSLWNETAVHVVAEKFDVSRGLAQQLMTASATFASCIVHFCEELDEFWPFADMFRSMTKRLHNCASKELLPLMDLPSVKIGRAKQLFSAGFKNLHSIAKAEPEELVQKVENLSRKVANQLVTTAKLLLLEKVENLREEAEDVLEGMVL